MSFSDNLDQYIKDNEAKKKSTGFSKHLDEFIAQREKQLQLSITVEAKSIIPPQTETHFSHSPLYLFNDQPCVNNAESTLQQIVNQQLSIRNGMDEVISFVAVMTKAASIYGHDPLCNDKAISRWKDLKQAGLKHLLALFKRVDFQKTTCKICELRSCATFTFSDDDNEECHSNVYCLVVECNSRFYNTTVFIPLAPDDIKWLNLDTTYAPHVDANIFTIKPISPTLAIAVDTFSFTENEKNILTPKLVEAALVGLL